MTHLCLVLPFPPSVNGLYAGKQRRYKSKRYTAWCLEASMALMRQRPFKCFTGNVTEIISLGRPDKRTRDVWNYEKAINDLLVEHEVLEDDSLIQKGTIQWAPDVVGAMVELEG